MHLSAHQITVVVLTSGLLQAMSPAPPLLADDARQGVDKQGSAGATFFESKVRPILVEHCYECHSVEAQIAEGGLRVDSRSAIRRGGSRGPAVVPGQPDASLLLAAVAHRDADLKMPPKSDQLSDQVIADLRRWIEMGAPDPRGTEASDSDKDLKVTETSRRHWAYQPPSTSEVPEGSGDDWSLTDVDRFIFRMLHQHGLTPSADAVPTILLRRLHFDLLGLPPSPSAIDQFLSQCQTDGIESALALQVDALLASPEFGVRWGRHWLDVARFGESSGGESNISFPYAWRYRDYVIDCVNADVPYDRFLTEQIAGDLLPANTDAERARLLTATGYLAVGTKNLGENNELKFQADIVDEQIDSLTRGVLASSVACARCHHHKFDPFTMEDYYGLAGIFASTKCYFGTFTSPANNRSGDPLVLPRVPGQVILHESLSPERLADLRSKFAELEAERQEIEAAQRALFAGETPEKTFTLREVLANIWRRGPIEGKLETVDDRGRALPLTMGVLDREQVVDVPLLARGDLGRPGEIVARSLPSAPAFAAAIDIPGDQSGRLELARWLTDPEHPLTSRVFVNRVWHHLFGAGLASTVDNFGTTGAAPSHPELLDRLAIEFIDDGWSLKRLVRRLVLSRTYRQASDYRADAFELDPENRLLWHMPKRRLEAEAIRDAMLAVSGELSLAQPEGSLVATMIGDRPISLIGLDKKLPKDLDGAVYRSAYLPVIRDRLPDVLALFDFAEPSLVTGEREQTNVPLQALYLMNSPFVQQRADGLASRLQRETTTDQERVQLAFRLCFARLPDANERERCIAFLQQPKDAPDAGAIGDANLDSLCQALLSTAEFRNLD